MLSAMSVVETKSKNLRTWISAGAVMALGAAAVAIPTTASAAETVEFTTVGPATWVVPENVTSVKVFGLGGGGAGGEGDSGSPNSEGGNGALVTVEASVSPGDQLTLFVGGGGDTSNQPCEYVSL